MSNTTHNIPGGGDELTSGGFSALLGAAADGIIIIDNGGRILNFNRAAEKLFGYDADEVMNKNVKILMPEPYRHEHDGYIERYNITRNPKIIGIGRKVEAKRKDSTVFPIELSVGEYIEDDTHYYIGIIRDLTNREKADKALRDSQERLREREQALDVTLHNAPIGIITLNPDGDLLSANQAACELVGYSEFELSGMNCRELVHPDDLSMMEQHRRDLLHSNDSSFTLNARFMSKEAEPVHVVLHCGLVKGDSDQTPHRLIAQLVDRTDQVKAEQEARETRERFAHVDRISTMGEMASGIAHEINQPLTAISSYVQACIRRLDSGQVDEEKLRELLAKTDEQSQRAGTIVRRIRSLIRSHDRVREHLDINELVADTIDLATVGTDDSKLDVSLQLMPESCEVIADGVQVQQVLLNLIRNAIDAAEEGQFPGGPIIIGTRNAKVHDYVEIWVRDFGNGIPDEIRERLFEPFVTSKKSGTGMGLSISRSIVNSHGGELWSENMDSGTTFRFTLPVAVRDSDSTS
jgi:two-component system sensor kinase FixL